MASSLAEPHSLTASCSGRQPLEGPGMSRSPSKQSLLPTKKQLIWSKAEASAWFCAALLVVYYGDGVSTVVHIVRHDERVKRIWVLAGLGFLGVDFLTFLYLSIWIKRVKHGSKDKAKAAPTVITTETLSTTAAGIMFMVAFWPVWRLYTPAVLVVLFMAFTMLSQLRPSTWVYQKRRAKHA